MPYRFATPEDASVLAQLNHQLIRDEGHRNPMTIPELVNRMEGWLRGEYRAVLFEENGQVLGYALYRCEPDFVYLRQLFVRSDRRRRGIGRGVIQWLWANAWRDAARLRIDVLVNNAAGLAFWQAMGFREYAISMEMTPPSS